MVFGAAGVESRMIDLYLIRGGPYGPFKFYRGTGKSYL